MPITLFGFIWLAICIVLFFNRDIKKFVFLTLFSLVLQSTNVIAYNGISIGPAIITCFLFLLRYLIYHIGNEMTLKFSFNKFNVILSILFAVILISLLVNHTFKFNIIIRVIQLFIYILCFNKLYKIRKIFDEKYIEKMIRIITYFVLVMGVIQILTTANILPRISLITMLFYNDHSANVYYHMNHYRRLCSVFMEPSYCACYLCAVFMYFSNKKFTNKNIVLLVFIALEVLLGFSTTGYIALVISTFIFLIGRFNSRTGKYLLTCGLFALIFLLIFFNDTLNQVIFDKMSSGSANTRYYWNRNALRAFQSSKFFGVGYKNVRASTIFYSLLGELGLFGLIFYLALNLSILLFIFKNRSHKYHNVLGIGLGIISICICQAIACPDLDLCVYWLFMFLFAISNNLSLNTEMSSIALVEEPVQLENSYMTGNLN